MGMKMTLTMKPIMPTIRKPMPVRRATLENSFCGTQEEQAAGGRVGAGGRRVKEPQAAARLLWEAAWRPPL